MRWPSGRRHRTPNLLGRRLINAKPQPHGGELDHGEKVVSQFVVAGGDAAEVLQFREEPLDQIALAIEAFAEAGFPFSVRFWRYVRRSPLLVDQLPDAVGVIGLISQHDHVRAEPIEQFIGGLAIMCLACRQVEPDREPLRVNDRMDFRCEAASGATETMISIPLFAVAACWWARTEVLSIIWMSPSWAAVMASIIRSQTPAFRHRVKRL